MLGDYKINPFYSYAVLCVVIGSETDDFPPKRHVNLTLNMVTSCTLGNRLYIQELVVTIILIYDMRVVLQNSKKPNMPPRKRDNFITSLFL